MIEKSKIEKIKPLWLEGKKYDAIAKELNISKQSAKAICIYLAQHKGKLDFMFENYNPLKVLSKAERKIYSDVVKNCITDKKELAKRHNLSINTVIAYMQAIRIKLCCKNSAEIIYKHYKTYYVKRKDIK